MTPFPANQLDSFRDYLHNVNIADGSISLYVGHLQRYLRWCEESYCQSPTLLYRSNLLEFKSYLLNIRKLKGETVNVYLSALSAYNDFLMETGQQEESAFHKRDYIRCQTPVTNPWDHEESAVQALRQKLLTEDKRHGKRNYALITLMAYTGLRVSEAVGLLLEDVLFTTRELLVRKGKGGVARTVAMNDKVIYGLEQYLTIRPRYPQSPYLFISQKGNKLHRSQVNRICSKYSSDKLHPHELRHFYCTKSQTVGFQLYETAQQAGHKDPRTTLRYVHPSKKEMREKANLM